MQKVTPFLWFNDQAEEAAHFYCSVFANSRVVSRMAGPGGKAMSATFEIEGQQFIAFNGGPHYQLTPAISLFVDCHSQAEVDELWDKLGQGGAPNRCGWLTDRYGLSWQIIPSLLGELLQDQDAARAQRAMEAMLKMDKIDLDLLRKAGAGE